MFNYQIRQKKSIFSKLQTLTPPLTCNEHTNYVLQRAITSLITLYPLINKRSVLSKGSKLTIYTMIIRPALTYACSVWSYMSATNYNKLQITENKFLRLLGNYSKYVYLKRIDSNLGIEHIEDYVKKVAINFFERISNHTNIHVKRHQTLYPRKAQKQNNYAYSTKVN